MTSVAGVNQTSLIKVSDIVTKYKTILKTIADDRSKVLISDIVKQNIDKFNTECSKYLDDPRRVNATISTDVTFDQNMRIELSPVSYTFDNRPYYDAILTKVGIELRRLIAEAGYIVDINKTDSKQIRFSIPENLKAELKKIITATQ